jgi:hypothetical protein
VFEEFTSVVVGVDAAVGVDDCDDDLAAVVGVEDCDDDLAAVVGVDGVVGVVAANELSTAGVATGVASLVVAAAVADAALEPVALLEPGAPTVPPSLNNTGEP